MDLPPFQVSDNPVLHQVCVDFCSLHLMHTLDKMLFTAEKINTIRPNKFDGFNVNSKPITETPIDFATEPNPDSTTVLSTDAEPLPSLVGTLAEEI